MARRGGLFITVRTEGGILPADLLQRIVEGDRDLGGLRPEDYHLSGERLNEAITRSWIRMQAAWPAFRAALARLPEGDLATSVTRERWLLPLFAELGYGRLVPARAVEIDGKMYAVSHGWQHAPIHLVGCRLDLDRRTSGVAGAARTNPHGLVQELLNRSKDNLWGFVSNGLRLRILRDNVSLTRQPYVEFDLESMMAGEVYADFVLLWLVCHQSRLEAERPEGCWLERWSQTAREQGTRALDHLRQGVEKAIVALGRGFLLPRNATLREHLRSGALDKQDYYRQLLRTVYRLLFLFVAEDRGLLLHPKADVATRERYARFYSTARLRRLADRQRGTRHVDLWRGLVLVFDALGNDAGCPALGLPALGSFLWSVGAAPDLAGCDLANRDLLDAVSALAFTREGKLRRAVDYRNLGSEELGSIYEALLELDPRINLDAGAFELGTAGGHERKTTGSYYTPSSLIQCLLDSALDPVLDEAARKPSPEAAILDLKVCDPACGSGHFLIAAAHRIARRLAAVRTGDEEPSPEATRAALRDVISRCIYGVDVNEMAVELCKVSLWMEALEPGRPLSFLDHRIVCGNSLLGTTPALMAGGIPDEVFTAIEGDDKAVVTALRKRNRRERDGQMTLPMVAEPGGEYAVLTSAFGSLGASGDESIEIVHAKEQQLEGLMASAGYQKAKLLADAWCAAFVWRKAKRMVDPVTQDVFLTLGSRSDRVAPATRAEIIRLAGQYRFLHWHLAFPDVFPLPRPGELPGHAPGGWTGGFDLVLGNPPWEHIDLKEKEWFAVRRPDIANAATGAKRKELIGALAEEDPPLHAAFLEARRRHEAIAHFLGQSGRFPVCGRGRINTYAVFAETNRLILHATGRVGCIVPSGIATDDTTKFFFQAVVGSRTLVSLYEFENEGFFATGKGHMNRFCLLVLTGRDRRTESADFVFQVQDIHELADADRHFEMSADDFSLLNPNTRTAPIFRSKCDAQLTRAIYRRVPVLLREDLPNANPWGVSFMQGLFNMTGASGLFQTRRRLEAEGWRLTGNVFRRDHHEFLPLYEGKMIHHFDHRFGDYRDMPPNQAGHQLPAVPPTRLEDPTYLPLPRYWVLRREVADRLGARWDHGWLLAWRDVSDSRASARTVISTVIPRVGVGNNLPLVILDRTQLPKSPCLVANLTAFVYDYASRQKISGNHVNFFAFEQLPVLPPSSYDSLALWAPDWRLEEWIRPRVLELTYTAWDLEAFARDLGWHGPPFRWDSERRFLLRCELDAAFLHLYGLGFKEAGYVLGTFTGVKGVDLERWGEYRTKRVILDIYDAMAEAGRTGTPYRSALDPPPGDGRVAHPAAGQAWPRTDGA